MNTFVIVPNKKHYFFSEINQENIFIEEEPFLTETNKFLSLLQRILKKINWGQCYNLFLKKWKANLLICKNCIIFDQAFSPSIVKYIHTINPHLNIYIYLWNPIFKNYKIIKKLNSVKSFTHVYSFDKNDCKKYGFSFSPMIYNFDSKKVEKNFNKYDVIFVGYLKNRGMWLTNIYNHLEKQKTCNFFYVQSNQITEILPFKLHKKYLDYQVYLENMLSSKAVLDIVQNGQIGLTIRSLEALCYEKKLITNNQDILTYNFYNKNNIFILGIDDINTLITFINTPFVKIDKEIIRQYNFVDWIQSFSTLRGN